MNISKRLSVIAVFVILSIATFTFIGFYFVEQFVGVFYYPNAIEGNYGRKYLWVFGLSVFVNWLYIIYIAIRGELDIKLKKFGISALVLLLLVVGFYLASLVPRNYHVEYYLGQEKYSIPWQYNPINGSHAPGGEYFVINVIYPGLVGQYSYKGNHQHQMTLAKYVFSGKKETATLLDEICYKETCGELSYNSGTYFVDNGFVYYIYYRGGLVAFHNRDELSVFKKSIVNLFDSFKVR